VCVAQVSVQSARALLRIRHAEPSARSSDGENALRWSLPLVSRRQLSRKNYTAFVGCRASFDRARRSGGRPWSAVRPSYNGQI